MFENTKLKISAIFFVVNNHITKKIFASLKFKACSLVSLTLLIKLQRSVAVLIGRKQFPKNFSCFFQYVGCPSHYCVPHTFDKAPAVCSSTNWEKTIPEELLLFFFNMLDSFFRSFLFSNQIFWKERKLKFPYDV